MFILLNFCNLILSLVLFKNESQLFQLFSPGTWILLSSALITLLTEISFVDSPPFYTLLTKLIVLEV